MIDFEKMTDEELWENDEYQRMNRPDFSRSFWGAIRRETGLRLPERRVTKKRAQMLMENWGKPESVGPFPQNPNRFPPADVTLRAVIDGGKITGWVAQDPETGEPRG